MKTYWGLSAVERGYAIDHFAEQRRYANLGAFPDEIAIVAQEDAESAFYPAPHEPTVYGIVTK